MTKQISEHDQVILAVALILRERREALNISQSDLARRSGIHRSYIGDFERGSRNISVKNLSRLAFALDVPVSKVLNLAEKRVATEGPFKPQKKKPTKVKVSWAYGALTAQDVKDALDKTKKTQKELAKALGISRFYVSMILTGARPFTPELQRKCLHVFADWHGDF